MYEKKHEKLAPIHKFIFRIVLNSLLGFVFIAAALVIGIIGFIYFENMSNINAFSNAALILSGVGSTTAFLTNGGKIFAGIYALFSGLVFLSIIGIVFAPIIHRCFHKFHLE